MEEFFAVATFALKAYLGFAGAMIVLALTVFVLFLWANR